MKITLALGLLAGPAAALTAEYAAEFGYPAGVDVWCGKAYRASNNSFEPGGWLETPALSSVPLLDLTIQPRMNLYLADETYGSFLIDAGISYMNGKAYTNTTFNKQTNITSFSDQLFIDIQVTESGFDLLSGSNITVNTTGNEIVFSLAGLTPRLDPYAVVLIAATGDGAQSYTATTNLYYLPSRTDGGSVAKVDNLYGGILVQDYLTNSTAFTALFPYTYYVSWDGYLDLDIDHVREYKELGYNIIHIVPNAGLANEAFNFTQFVEFLDVMDELELWLMYDMRWTYKNLTSVTEQVTLLNAHKSILLYYTGDEPDGQVDPLNATKITYNHIKSIDPYHPISLCLNCGNYYFQDYTSGADIILTDPYPIAVNTSFSSQYDTVCNTTYGCCGCDDCNGNFEDVSSRLDTYKEYQTWLGGGEWDKPIWGVPQAFGNETFWGRYPTAEEETVMGMLFVNHGAKGIVMWDLPTTPEIGNVTSAMSKVLTSSAVSSYLLGSAVEVLEVKGTDRMDVAGWKVGNSLLVSVVNKEYTDSLYANVSITLPSIGTGLGTVYWGSGWSVSGSQLIKIGVDALEVDLFVVDLE